MEKKSRIESPRDSQKIFTFLPPQISSEHTPQQQSLSVTLALSHDVYANKPDRTTRSIMVLSGVPFVRLRTTGSSGTTPPNTTNATTTSTTSGGSTGMDQRIIDLSAMPPLPTTVSRRSIFTLLSFFPFVSTLFIIVEARWGTEAINRWRSNN